jgi:hypothetical protein
VDSGTTKLFNFFTLILKVSDAGLFRICNKQNLLPGLFFFENMKVYCDLQVQLSHEDLSASAFRLKPKLGSSIYNGVYIVLITK